MDVPSQELLNTTKVSSSMIPTLNLTEIRCKNTLKFSVETVSPSRLVIKTGKTNSLIFHRLRRNFSFIYKSTKDNKLRQFLFRLLHRIIITKEEFFKFRLVEDEECTLCFRPDSIEHAFLDCTVTTAFYSKAISWFNQENDTDITLSSKLITYLTTSHV